jgi:electron transfer flavoprotein alpha subunit
MLRALVIAEHDGRELHVNTAKCVECARAFGLDAIEVLVLASDSADSTVSEAARVVAGVSKVLCDVDARNAHCLAAVVAPRVAALASDYTHVLAPSSTFGKDLLPRAAALLGVGQLSDIMAADGPYRFKRPIYAGNAIITVEADPNRCLVATVRTASFATAGMQPPAPMENVAVDVPVPTHTRFIAAESSASGRIDLQTATRVVAAAAARQRGELALFTILRVARGAVAASRAVVDSGRAERAASRATGKITPRASPSR